MVGRKGLTSRSLHYQQVTSQEMDTCGWIGQGVLFKLLVEYFIYFKKSRSMWKKIDN
jgi:hypothetical protein